MIICMQKDPDRYPDSSARDLVNMVAPVQNYNMQLTGGTEKMKYFAGIGYYKQEGLFDQVNYSRFNYNINLESKVTKTTTVILSVMSSMERSNDLDPSEDSSHMFRSAYKYLPIITFIIPMACGDNLQEMSLQCLMQEGRTKMIGIPY